MKNDLVGFFFCSCHELRASSKVLKCWRVLESLALVICYLQQSIGVHGG